VAQSWGSADEVGEVLKIGCRRGQRDCNDDVNERLAISNARIENGAGRGVASLDLPVYCMFC